MSVSRMAVTSLDGNNATAFVPTTIVNIPATAFVAGTPQAIYTPAGGRKWRLLGWCLSTTVAGSIIFKQGGTEKFRTPVLVANSPYSHESLGGGLAGTAAAAALQMDVTVAGTVSGYLLIADEAF